MISVNCSQCRAVLEMDDAFAGGVCRCHYCGTIQTVPANAKRAAQVAATQAAPAVQGASRQVGAAAADSPAYGDGLSALANAISDNGATRAAAQAPAPPAATVDYARPQQQKSLLVPLLIGLAILVLLMCVLLGYLILGRTTVVSTGGGGPGTGGTGGPPGSSPNSSGDPAVVVPTDPHFLGIDLTNASSVVYVLDRGQATAELFDTLKEATYRSLETLKPGQKFQIIFWDKPGEQLGYPADGPVGVSKQEIDAAREQFADVIASGRATADSAIARAAQGKPAVIVLVTGKAFDLEEELVRKVQNATAASGTKVHTVALRSDDGNTVLKDIASRTSGEFKVVQEPELRRYSY